MPILATETPHLNTVQFHYFGSEGYRVDRQALTDLVIRAFGPLSKFQMNSRIGIRCLTSRCEELRLNFLGQHFYMAEPIIAERNNGPNISPYNEKDNNIVKLFKKNEEEEEERTPNDRTVELLQKRDPGPMHNCRLRLSFEKKTALLHACSNDRARHKIPEGIGPRGQGVTFSFDEAGITQAPAY